MSADVPIEAPGIDEPDLGKDQMVFRGQRLQVAWATCWTCSRQAVPLDGGGLCDLCGPVAAAVAAATPVTKAKY